MNAMENHAVSLQAGANAHRKADKKDKDNHCSQSHFFFLFPPPFALVSFTLGVRECVALSE